MQNHAGLTLDLPPEAHAELAAVGPAWDDEDAAEAHVLAALAAAPDALAARIGAYKYYFYRHHLDKALPQALACLDMAKRRLQLPHDWQDIRPQDAAFDRIEPWPRLFLQSLVAYGYVLVRLGRVEEGRIALLKAAELDGADRLGAGRLVALIDRGEEENED